VAHFAYVANSDNTISEYTVDPVTGALASVGSPQVFGKAGATITKVASDPAGNYVFFLDMTNKQLLSATIDRSSGALAAADAIALPGGGPETLAVSPDGKFVYVANFSSASPATPNSGVLAIFAVLPGGKLSPSGTPALTELNVYSMTIDASGRHLYVSANSTGGPVNVFALDPASGSAHFLGLTGSPSGIRGTVLSPTGFAYELASGDVVDAYPVLSDGTFGGVTGQTTLAGSNNNALTMDGQGRFVYVTELDPFVHRISVLKADAKTGALSAGKDFITTAAAAPQAITADPTGRFVYTANANDSVSAFSIDGATGTLTQVGTNLTNSSSPAARPFSIVLTK
jgi:6-phosphogluconolactonase (cycloisomerase 2 family)